LACNQSVRPWTILAVAFLGAGVWCPSLQAAEDAKQPWLRQAEQLEKEGRWEKACDLYDQVLARERNLPGVRERYHACLRHVNQIRRHRDATFREQVLNRDVRAALRVYAEVLGKLRATYVDRDRADLTHLFRYGLDELRQALDDAEFRQEQLPDATQESVRAFRDGLLIAWGSREIASVRDAQALVSEVAVAAQKDLGLKGVVTVLEFACGACNGLDEHTYFLTPGQLNDVFASLEGEFVGIGIEVEVVGTKLIVKEVIPGSPAALEGVRAGDWIKRIDRKLVDPRTPEVEAERLKGEVGTTVELEVVNRADAKSRTLRLTRQTVNVPSVPRFQILDEMRGIAYCQLSAFQKTTLQEMDEALMQLKMQGMKVLILDLRGNQGGLFPVSLQVVERFLAEGVIVSTQSRIQNQNRIYRANNPGALALPLIVLVDGETASAAEVVAGALKENQRATLIGQTTFGKCSVQRILQLETVRGGIRVTFAKFFSPRGQDYSGCGVTPHIPVERTPLLDHPLDMALQEAIRLLAMRQ
jgi:carboxyl-terminal processing protease